MTDERSGRPREFSPTRLPDRDEDWSDLAANWNLREGTVYLNHGSFGPPPRPVRDARRRWMDRLDEQPMDFFVREHEGLIVESRKVLARFVGTSPDNLVFVENATMAMNVVAHSLQLNVGDQVLLNNHEYGAVHRIWNRACEESGAEVRVVDLGRRFESHDQIVDRIFDAVTDRTRLIVISHITSATAITMPVEAICRRAKTAGIPTCIDGPHALVQVDVELDRMGCDFYTASCHKWLSAAFGSGFLYVHPRWQQEIRTPLQSWGRLLPNEPRDWSEHFMWTGTRDSSAYYSVPTAIRFMESVGLDAFRSRTHFLAQSIRHQLEQKFGTSAWIPDSPDWYSSMVEIPLPPGDHSGLQSRLFHSGGIEVPIIHFENHWLIRISIHLYTTSTHLHHLTQSLP